MHESLGISCAIKLHCLLHPIVSKEMNILISGSSGFVGHSLCVYLKSNGHIITEINRSAPSQTFLSETYDCLISLAARAHVMHETAENVYRAYAEINIEYTLKMVRLAKNLNIKRFIFLSSVKVNGELSDIPFTEQSLPQPFDDYGKTKLEAEIALRHYCHSNGIELVIIRPPLIYGAQVKANLRSLIQLCKKPIPLPFGWVNNKRSLISLQNLNNFIALCCEHPDAANQTFLISDDHDVSTAELISTIRMAMKRKSLLIPVPVWLLKLAFRLFGKRNLSDRLLCNLQVDISKAKKELGWQPAISFSEGIQQSVEV